MSDSKSHKEDRRVFLTVRPDHGREVVAHVCLRARKAGVRPGMTLAHARALLHRHAVHVERDHPDRDLAALNALARWAVRIAPVVAVDPPDGLLMNVTGCARLYRGEARLAAELGEAMRRLGIHTRLAIAPSYGAAWACARFAEMPVTRMDEQEVPQRLAPLPVAGLRVDPDVIDDLAAVGVERIGQLLELPRPQLTDRFGDRLLQRIDQALGRCPEMIEPVHPASRPRAARAFDGPVKQLEAIELAVRGLIEQVSSRLRQIESGARELNLCLNRIDAQPIVETLRLGYPSRDAKHLWALVRPKIERINLGYGVEEVSLTVTASARMTQPQHALALEDAPLDTAAESSPDAAEMGRLIDLLVGRLGSQGVLRAEPVDTHVPEKMWRMVEARELCAKSPASAFHPENRSIPGSRPTVLLERARPVDITLMHPEGPILLLHTGSAQRVITTIGPERIALRWWRSTGPDQTPPQRDYYKLQLQDGRWLWTFREAGTRRWFLQGMWS